MTVEEVINSNVLPTSMSTSNYLHLVKLPNFETLLLM